MQKITSTKELKIAIQELEARQASEERELREQFHTTLESFKPINMLKHTFKEVVTSPDLGKGLLNTVIGLTTGFVGKKLLMGSTHNPIKKLLGIVLQFGISNVVANHPEGIKSVGTKLFNRIFNRHPPVTPEEFNNN